MLSYLLIYTLYIDWYLDPAIGIKEIITPVEYAYLMYHER